MDTSKRIRYQDVNAANDIELAKLTTRHAKELHRDFSLLCIRDYYEYERGWKEGMNTDLAEAVNRLKKLLDTRPHVPNKVDAKRIRQEAAKRGR